MVAPRNILVITYWHYSDALVQAYTLPYLRIILRKLPKGSSIHLVTLEKLKEVVPVIEEGIVHHPYPYHALGFRGAFMIIRLVWDLRRVINSNGVDTIHAWCTPAGMIGYLLSVFTRLPLIIDSYEPHAEAMVENGTWSKSGVGFKVLFWFERLQSQRAKVLIAAASGMKGYALKKYGVEGTPFYVKPACVDLERFDRDDLKDPSLLLELGLMDKFVMVYAGKFGGIYLDQEVFELIRVAVDHWGASLRVLLLTSHSKDELLPWMTHADLDPGIFTIKFVPHELIPKYMGLGDVALTPVRPVPTKQYCTPIKDGEYWALGLPVIITDNISDDSRIVRDHGIGAVLTRTDKEAYQAAIDRIAAYLATRTADERYKEIRAVAEKYRNFAIAEHIYSEVYG